MSVDTWDEIRTAFQVARLGTVSGAADVLGVHHATVIRHIDALEKRLGAKLFQRHARGYTATEAGRDLLTVAQTTEDQFGQLANRIKGQGASVSGELVITAISGISALMTPVLASYMLSHPDVTIRFLSDTRLFRLDYGEAHVAIRAGAAPQEPDNVVQPLVRLRVGLYGSQGYVAQYGKILGPQDYANHRYIGTVEPADRAPAYRWLAENTPDDRIVLRLNEREAITQAVLNGIGLGFVASREAEALPDLVEVMPTLSAWDSALWIVTHVDLHRSLKVQSFLHHLKQSAAGWSCGAATV